MSNTQRTFRPADAPEARPIPRRTLMKFDPTINSGTIIQIGVFIVAIAVAFTTVQGELRLQQSTIEANKVTATEAARNQDTATKELKGDLRELQRSVNEIKESVAILRGRAAEVPMRQR